jgi:hypothetical protein
MYESNVERILSSVSPSDLVLDLGGWARPFNRANFVMDSEPYDTRGYYGAAAPPQGGAEEHFSKETWIQRDICDRAPFPFRDKEIDFIVCSHTLEDIRDPIWVCSEMVRVGQRGYIEVPSRAMESCRGIEPGQVGWSHHRWLIDIVGNHIGFMMKHHMIHSHWRYSLPTSYLRHLSQQHQVQWLFWTDMFEYSETIIHGVGNIAIELERFVTMTQPYAKWLLELDHGYQEMLRMNHKLVRKLRRMFFEPGEQ